MMLRALHPGQGLRRVALRALHPGLGLQRVVLRALHPGQGLQPVVLRALHPGQGLQRVVLRALHPGRDLRHRREADPMWHQPRPVAMAGEICHRRTSKLRLWRRRGLMFRCPSRSMVMKRLDGDFDNMWRRSTPCLWIGCSTMDSLKVILHRFHGSVRLLLPMVSPSRRCVCRARTPEPTTVQT